MTMRTRMMDSSIGRYLCSSVLALAATGAIDVVVIAQPAAAQFTVFDPTNYSQNLLTAARALQQINNQIQSLQNQAAMLTNMAKNLSRVDFPELKQLQQTLQQIDQLMGQAQGIDFRIDGLDSQYQRLFPQDYGQAVTSNQHVIDSRARLDAAMSAFHQSMSVQSQIVGNVQTDAQTLAVLAARSQGAEGALQAQQATNQLLALATKQQFQIQNLMAAQYRAEAIEQARRAQAEADARNATTRFLGSGSAYSPH